MVYVNQVLFVELGDVTRSNIHGGATVNYCDKIVTANYTPSQMIDWVLNTPLVHPENCSLNALLKSKLLSY